MEVPIMKQSPSKGWSKKKFNGQWAKTLQKFLAKQQEEVPPGWYIGDVALKKMGLMGSCSGQRNKILNRMTDEGFLEKRDFRIFDASGRRIAAISHYKIAKPS